MADLHAQLAAALGDRYSIERELGQGGMATVWLARDGRHDRLVAIKVLRPELASSLGPDRFLREIKLAARLQHPHILTVLDSGESAGLLWYSMPFVDGESLRQRLVRHGALGVPDALRLIREVADALAYAHRQSVVHRDVKPENVLISGEHALVTDFGVAKAVRGAADGIGATTTGMALGTPAYMAPEQAAADPHVDGRADLYSLGVMAYEILTGVQPISGATPQQVLAAQVTRAPEPILHHRPHLPPALADAVMRCLEKLPADRFQSADELLAALGQVQLSTPGHGTVPTTAVPARRPVRSRVLAGAGVVVLAAGVLGLRALGWLGGSSLVAEGVLAKRERILVADFRSPAADSSLGATLTEAFRVDLAQQPAIQVVQPEYVQGVLQRMQRPANTPLDAATAREVAQRDGIKAIVVGDVARAGASYSIASRLIATGTGETLVALRETADDSTGILAALDKLSRDMRKRIGGTVERVKGDDGLEQVTTPSLEALRKYTEAQRAVRAEEFPRAVSLLTDATTLDTAFAMAWRKLGILYQNAGTEPAKRVDALTRAFRHRDRLSQRERYVTEGTYYAMIGDFDRQAAAYRSALELNPDDPIALNNLAILLMGPKRDPAGAMKLLQRAVGNDSSNPINFNSLVEAQIAAGKPDSARATAVLALRRFPHSSSAAEAMTEVLAAGQQWDAADSFAAVRASANSGDPVSAAAALNYRGFLAAMHGRLAKADGFVREVSAIADRTGQRAQALHSEADRAQMFAWETGRSERPLAILDSALRRYPLASLAPADRPYFPLANAYSFAGRPDRARALIAEWQRITPPELQAGAAAALHSALGFARLAEHQPGAALAEFTAQDPVDCNVCALPDIAASLDQAGQADSARAVYERYLATPSPLKMYLDPAYLPRISFRLAEMYESKGDRAKAADFYQRFIALRRDADPELQPQVQEAKRRLAALGGDTRQ
jgi:serine/threonine-protein kinase